MPELSERLHRIADCIGSADVVADIGTDHGQLPVYLCKQALYRRVIMTDISQASLAKAMTYGAPYMTRDAAETSGDGSPTILEARVGDGLIPLQMGEADVVIMAGIGGRLMQHILEAEPEKALRVGRFILQPRRAVGDLRRYLVATGYHILQERLVREGRYIWEILVCCPPGVGQTETPTAAKSAIGAIQWEVPTYYGRIRDPLAEEYLMRKLAREERNLLAQQRATVETEEEQVRTQGNIDYLKSLLQERRTIANHPMP